MMAFGGQMFDAHMEPPKVPPRKEKRPKVKQDTKPKPYAESTPAPLSPAHPGDKLSREQQRPDPYTTKAGKATRISAQDKLQRERLRILAGSGSGLSQPNSNASRASLPPSYRSMSPTRTFTTLPPYSPGVQTQQGEGAQRKRTSLFRRLSWASLSRTEGVREAHQADSAEVTGPLPTIPQSE